MIPSVISHQVRRGIEDFLRTTFPIHTPFFDGVMERLLDASAQAIFKGPYISVKLPFTSGTKGRNYFPDMPLHYPPYLHQEQAFQRLSRKQRQSIWPVFEEYRAILNRHHSKEFIDAIRDARVLLESRAPHTEYRAVIVDEAQDMSAEAFRLIRQIVPPVAGRTNDLFIVGDAHQRIYAHRVVLSRCGIDIRGRSRKLRLNYRTTDEIRKWAVAMLEDCDIDDLDGGQDDNKGFRSLLHGDYPEIQQQATFEEEIEVIAEHIQQLETEQIPLSAICVVARTQNLLEQYESALQAKGIDHLRIQHQVSDDSAKPGLRTATMHRVKGLEFDVMIIAGVNDGIVPLANAVADADSDYAQIEVETKERSLLYVAATRAKNHVLISCSGSPSKFIE